MTLKDIYDYVFSDWCGGNCLRSLNNNGACPYELGNFSYCAIDSVILSLDYLARGEYYG